MTVEEKVEEMQKMFGELPNPDHYPLAFQHLVKLYEYYKAIDFN